MKVKIDFDNRVIALNALGGYLGMVTAAGQTMYWLARAHPKLVREWGFKFYPEEDQITDIDFTLEISNAWERAADEIARFVKDGSKKTCGHRCDVHEE